MLHGLVAALELNLEGLGEILPEVVRCAGLQRAAVAHHRFDRIRARRAGELLALALDAVDHRHRELGLAELLIEREDLQRFGFGFFRRLMRGVTFLPEKLRRAQERPRDLLPADHIGPLIDEHGQVAPRLHPPGVHRPDHHFGGRAHDQFLLEVLVAAARHPRHLRRESVDMFLLFHEQAFGNEQREIRVDVARRLESRVQEALDVLPDRVAVRTDDHAALDRRVVGHLGALHHVEVPLGKILRTRRDRRHERVGLVAWGRFHRLCLLIH